MSDPLPLPFCPECGYTQPYHNIGSHIHTAGPVDWRSYPGFRCGCRIVWEAREAGLIDEACGGKGPPQKEYVRTISEWMSRHHREVLAWVEAHRRLQGQEACGGHGLPREEPVPDTVRRLVTELLAVPRPRSWNWSTDGLKEARAAMAQIDARVAAQAKAWEGKQW